MAKTLTFLQKRFVEEYAQRGNGSEAARQAGYSPYAARQQAYENLQKPHVRNALTTHTAVTYGDIELLVGHLKELLNSENLTIRFRALKLLMKIKGII